MRVIYRQGDDYVNFDAITGDRKKIACLDSGIMLVCRN